MGNGSWWIMWTTSWLVLGGVESSPVTLLKLPGGEVESNLVNLPRGGKGPNPLALLFNQPNRPIFRRRATIEDLLSALYTQKSEKSPTLAQKFEFVGPRPRRRFDCIVNAGLSHNCDYRDAIGAAEESQYWGYSSPGKRTPVATRNQ